MVIHQVLYVILNVGLFTLPPHVIHHKINKINNFIKKLKGTQNCYIYATERNVKTTNWLCIVMVNYCSLKRSAELRTLPQDEEIIPSGMGFTDIKARNNAEEKIWCAPHMSRRDEPNMCVNWVYGHSINIQFDRKGNKGRDKVPREGTW